MDDNIVAALAVFCLFGLPVLGWIITRLFRFIERIEMIKRGIVPPPEINISRRAYRDWKRSGGVGPMPGMQQPFGQPYVAQQPFTAPPPPPFVRQPQQQNGWGYDDDAQRALYKGIRLTAIGFAIVVGLSFIGGTPGTANFHGGAWLLGGLIPMFVGVAQMIVALISGAQLPGGRTNYGPPPPPPQQQAPPPSSSAWEQPRGPRFEELSKPVKPPDLR